MAKRIDHEIRGALSLEERYPVDGLRIPGNGKLAISHHIDESISIAEPIHPWKIIARSEGSSGDERVSVYLIQHSASPERRSVVELFAYFPNVDGEEIAVDGNPVQLPVLERFAQTLLEVIAEAKRAHPEIAQ
jgi:hypothetical protein